jgi:AraC-like DNA-binding protein
MKGKFPRFLVRLITFSVLLSIIPTALLATWLFYRSSDIIQSKVNDSNMLVLKQTELRVEQALTNVHNSFVYFTNSALVGESMQKSLTYRDFQFYDSIMDEIAKVQTYYLRIGDVSLINFDKDWVISERGIHSFQSMKNKDEVVRYRNRADFTFWDSVRNENYGEKTAFLNEYIRLNGLNYVLKIPSGPSNSSGLLIVNIPVSEINSYILKGDKSGEVMILDSDYRIIASQSPSLIGKRLPEEAFPVKKRQAPFASGSFDGIFDQQEAAISFIKSDFNGWIYMSVSSISDIRKDSTQIGWIAFWGYVLIILVTCVVSIAIAYRMYNPLQSLYRSVMKVEGKSGLERGRDEIKVIGRSVQSLMETKSKMATRIDDQLEQLKEFFILKLFEGEMQDDLQLIGSGSTWEWLAVVALEIDDFRETRYEVRDRSLLTFSMLNIANEVIPADNRLLSVTIKDYHIVIIRGTGNQDRFQEFVYSTFEQVQTAIKQYLDMKVSVGISRPYTQFSQTYIAYAESIEALKYRLHFGEEAILFIKDVKPSVSTHSHFPTQSEAELIEAIKQGDMEKVDNIADQILTEILQEKSSLHEYQISLVRILTDIIKVLQDTGESAEAVFSREGERSIFNELFELRTKKEIKDWLKASIIVPIMHFLEERKGVQYKDIARKVEDMVRCEYDTDLTIDVCAARMNYHPSYIRRIFKRETGVNFSEYLAHYRLNVAKEWLRDSDITITEIADRLRYNNVQNYIRHFKNLEGITPGQYRTNYLNSEQVRRFR